MFNGEKCDSGKYYITLYNSKHVTRIKNKTNQNSILCLLSMKLS